MLALKLLDDTDEISGRNIAAAGDDGNTARGVDCRPADSGMALQPGLHRAREGSTPFLGNPAHPDVDAAVTTPHHARLPQPANSAPDGRRHPSRARHQGQIRYRVGRPARAVSRQNPHAGVLAGRWTEIPVLIAAWFDTACTLRIALAG